MTVIGSQRKTQKERLEGAAIRPGPRKGDGKQEQENRQEEKGARETRMSSHMWNGSQRGLIG